MVFENVFSNFLANFNNFVDEKYILIKKQCNNTY